MVFLIDRKLRVLARTFIAKLRFNAKIRVKKMDILKFYQGEPFGFSVDRILEKRKRWPQLPLSLQPGTVQSIMKKLRSDPFKGRQITTSDSISVSNPSP